METVDKELEQLRIDNPAAAAKLEAKRKKQAAQSAENNRILTFEIAKDVPDFDKCRTLMRQGGDESFNLLMADSESGNTLLHRAAFSGIDDIVKSLIKAKADVNGKNDLGRTPLHMAAEKNKPNALKLLVADGADYHLTTMGGSTALHLACREGAREAIALLLKKSDIVVDPEDDNRKTPMDLTLDDKVKQMLKKAMENKAAAMFHSDDDVF